MRLSFKGCSRTSQRSRLAAGAVVLSLSDCVDLNRAECAQKRYQDCEAFASLSATKSSKCCKRARRRVLKGVARHHNVDMNEVVLRALMGAPDRAILAWPAAADLSDQINFLCAASPLLSLSSTFQDRSHRYRYHYGPVGSHLNIPGVVVSISFSDKSSHKGAGGESHGIRPT